MYEAFDGPALGVDAAGPAASAGCRPPIPLHPIFNN